MEYQSGKSLGPEIFHRNTHTMGRLPLSVSFSTDLIFDELGTSGPEILRQHNHYGNGRRGPMYVFICIQLGRTPVSVV